MSSSDDLVTIYGRSPLPLSAEPATSGSYSEMSLSEESSSSSSMMSDDDGTDRISFPHGKDGRVFFPPGNDGSSLLPAWQGQT